MSIAQKINDAVTQGTVSFFETMLGMEVSPKAPVDDGNVDFSPCISAAIGMSGDLSGTMAFHVPTQVAGAIIESWLGESLDPDSAEVRDAVGEIVNIVLGDAKTTMSSGNININLSIPHVISGREYKISYRPDVEVAMIPFDSPIGEFVVEVATKTA